MTDENRPTVVMVTASGGPFVPEDHQIRSPSGVEYARAALECLLSQQPIPEWLAWLLVAAQSGKTEAEALASMPPHLRALVNPSVPLPFPRATPSASRP
jgi:hypothetical protein